jgi:hypothetical protein
LDAQNIQLLQEQVAQLTNALTLKDELGDRQAEALMEVARASDNRARDLELQYTEKLAKLEFAHDAATAAKDAAIADMSRRFAELEASHARTVAAKDAAFANLEREHAGLKADVAARLSAVYTVVTSKLALELHPIRTDRRQFATLHVGPVPCSEFDTAWCAAACGNKWKVDIDPVTHMRARVTQHRRGHVTLRGAAPLPRRLPSSGASPQQLPSYRVIVEAYPGAVDGEDTQFCNVGFVPSHTSTDGAAVSPVVGRNIHDYGGWWFQVHPTEPRHLSVGSTLIVWTSLLPRAVSTGDAAAAAGTSTYATTDAVPPVPAGGAVEFAVDYAAGTCRVAFYAPAAVAGGFVEAPYAKMELRFVATAAEVVSESWGAVPARSVPTAAADSRVQLYPAVATQFSGATWRFV